MSSGKYHSLHLIKNSSFIITTIIILMAPAIWNGYPPFTADTKRYLILTTHAQSQAYGLFAKFFSLSISYWFTAVSQCMLAVYLLHSLQKIILPNLSTRTHMALIALCALSTHLAFYASQLSPDIFLSYGILSLAIFILSHSKQKKVISYLLLLISMSMHTSFLLSIGILLIPLTLFSFRKPYQAVAYILAPILALQIILLSNFYIHGTYALPKNNKVFLIAGLLKYGILDGYFEKECPNAKLDICNEWKSGLLSNTNHYMWGGKYLSDEANKLAQSLRGKVRSLERTEQFFLMADIFFSQKEKIIKMLIRETTNGFFQVQHINNLPKSEKQKGAPQYIFPKYGADKSIYLKSKLIEDSSAFNKASFVYAYVESTSAAIVLILILFSFLLRSKKLSTHVCMSYLSLLIPALLLNIIVSVVFSDFFQRYSARVNWLLLHVIFIILFTLASVNREKQSTR